MIAKIQELRLENDVVFSGHRNDMESAYAALDMVVAPSTRPDPFCLVVAEAMAAGRPVISTDSGGPKEIIEHGVSGLLIPPDNPMTFANELEKLIRNPSLRRALGDAGRTRILKHFSRDAFNTRVLAALRELA